MAEKVVGPHRRDRRDAGSHHFERRRTEPDALEIVRLDIGSSD